MGLITKNIELKDYTQHKRKNNNIFSLICLTKLTYCTS